VKGKQGIVAGRYAKSLIELAIETDEVDGLFADMVAVQEVVANAPHFLKAFSDERVRPSVRFAAAKNVSRALKLRRASENAILLLIAKKRIELLPQMARAVIADIRLRKKFAMARAQVANAEFVDNVKRGVEEVLSGLLGLKVECETSLDPDLLGGFVLEAGDKRFDSSVRGKLTMMKEEFFSETRGC
jgi:F-type H+-transporting ATPase subunit delta